MSEYKTLQENQSLNAEYERHKRETEMVNEIERLTKQNKALNEVYELTKKEYIRLNNIIKEVRELVENGSNFKSIYFKKDEEDLWKVILADEIKEKYLEILDKGE